MTQQQASFFLTRGAVVTPGDLSLGDWPQRAAAAGLTTLALHDSRSPAHVVQFIESEPGQQFLETCSRLGLQVEYELHAISELLPRDLFGKDPSLFRMNEASERTPDANLCVSSPVALAIAAENAVKLSQRLRPTTGRYFLWGDDGAEWCRCRRCGDLSDSDQALILEHQLLEALRTVDSRATVAHLAYARTYVPPMAVRPAPGIFLEFAPIDRRYDIPFATRDAGHAVLQDQLAANLEVFGGDGAQVLEYWLDASLFSRWQKPAVRIPWNRDVFEADLRYYWSLGIRHVTTFAVFVDAAYLSRYGEPPIEDYGSHLLGS